MHKGGILLVTGAVLACTACLGSEGKLEIRSAGTGLRTGAEPVPFRIAEARGQLAIGNVALALEGFRKAAREDPTSAEALAGVAQCYDLMRRFDLARTNYERALALAPRDPALLSLLAGSLDRQGLAAEAAAVRRELAALQTATPQMAAVAPTEPTEVVLPPEVAAPVGQSVTIALPPPRPVEAPAPQQVALAPVGRSVTIALPPPRPVAPAPARQPRIERLSLTEVALVTGDGPRWKRLEAPVRSAAMKGNTAPVELRLLNAARIDRLAARTRSYLGQFGWREVTLGDAVVTRKRSLILYPARAKAAASRLAARLGFAAVPRKDVRELTILLGRDAAEHPALRPGA